MTWNPTVEEGKCVGYELCSTGCGMGAYDRNFEKSRQKPRHTYHNLKKVEIVQ